MQTMQVGMAGFLVFYSSFLTSSILFLPIDQGNLQYNVGTLLVRERMKEGPREYLF